MLKKIVIFILFAALIAAAFLQYGYIEKSSRDLSGYSSRALDAARSGRMDSALGVMQALDKKWQKAQPYYEALMEHSESDKIAVSLHKCLEYAKSGDKTQFLAEADALDYLLRHIQEIDTFSLENIL